VGRPGECVSSALALQDRRDEVSRRTKVAGVDSIIANLHLEVATVVTLVPEEFLIVADELAGLRVGAEDGAAEA